MKKNKKVDSHLLQDNELGLSVENPNSNSIFDFRKRAGKIKRK